MKDFFVHKCLQLISKTTSYHKDLFKVREAYNQNHSPEAATKRRSLKMKNNSSKILKA